MSKMTSQQYQDIKTATYAKMMERLHVVPSIREELNKAFATWFQGIVQAVKATQVATAQPQQAEATSPMPPAGGDQGATQ